MPAREMGKRKRGKWREREREKQRGKKRREKNPLLFVQKVIIRGVYIQLPRELSIVFKDKE